MIAASCNYDRKSATTVETDQKAQAEPPRKNAAVSRGVFIEAKARRTAGAPEGSRLDRYALLLRRRFDPAVEPVSLLVGTGSKEQRVRRLLLEAVAESDAP